MRVSVRRVRSLGRSTDPVIRPDVTARHVMPVEGELVALDVGRPLTVAQDSGRLWQTGTAVESIQRGATLAAAYTAHHEYRVKFLLASGDESSAGSAAVSPQARIRRSSQSPRRSLALARSLSRQVP